MANDMKSSLETLFGKMEDFITTKTVVGQPTEIAGVVIVPMVDITFAVGAGNGKGGKAEQESGGGGGGALGAKLTPSAVLVIQKDGTVQLVNVKAQDSINKIIDMVPGVISKLNLNSFFKDKKDSAAEKKEPPEKEVVVEKTIITETFE